MQTVLMSHVVEIHSEVVNPLHLLKNFLFEVLSTNHPLQTTVSAFHKSDVPSEAYNVSILPTEETMNRYMRG
jgi:hypothetical protein